MRQDLEHRARADDAGPPLVDQDVQSAARRCVPNDGAAVVARRGDSVSAWERLAAPPWRAPPPLDHCSWYCHCHCHWPPTAAHTATHHPPQAVPPPPYTPRPPPKPCATMCDRRQRPLASNCEPPRDHNQSRQNARATANNREQPRGRATATSCEQPRAATGNHEHPQVAASSGEQLQSSPNTREHELAPSELRHQRHHHNHP